MMISKGIFYRFIIAVTTIMATVSCTERNSVLIDAESFTEKGGWVTDQQFMDQMGSPYLMAHGMGKPVDDAVTEIEFPKSGNYHIYVRTYNWTSPWTQNPGPGQFRIKVNGEYCGDVLGNAGDKWFWQYAGSVDLKKGKAEVALHDMTGFNGRCDAIYFTLDKGDVPPAGSAELKKWKADFRKINVAAEKKYDLVVVGGGVAGICATVTAARSGVKVALIHDRPVLGGNNSSEVRVHLGGRINMAPYPELGDIVAELGPDKGGNARPGSYYEDSKKMDIVANEENIDLFCNWHVSDVIKNGNSIESVIAENIVSGERMKFSADLFADCTGDGNVGYMAGADYMIGREGRDEFNESLAPEKPDSMMMGSSVQWYSKKGRNDTSFPVFKYGVEFNEENFQKVRKGEWTWEAGMQYHQVDDFERIRDYGLMVIYSNWSFLKNEYSKKEEFSRDSLDWVAYVAGKRESRRLVGDHILTENDIVGLVPYEDACVTTTWTIDLHRPNEKNSKYFPGEEFISTTTHIPIRPYAFPYRCLYTKDIDNLFMAGRNISVTHVALGTIRVMRTTGMMGEVVGLAAGICKNHNCLPRTVYTDYLDELKSVMRQGAGKDEIKNTQTYNWGEMLSE